MEVAGPARTGHGAGGPLSFLLCTLPSDSHMWNLVALQLFLEEMGHEVRNLGACTPVPLVLQTCRAERPDCVVVSTVNGLGGIDAARLITALRAEPEWSGLPVVIGGKLGVRGEADADPSAALRELGYDAVFPVGASAEPALAGFREFVAARVERVR